MKTLKWIALGVGIVVAGAAGYLFIGGNSPIAWSALPYTDAVAQAAKEGRPVLVEFGSPW